MVVCKNCAGQSPDGASTCVHCGARLAPYTPEETRAYVASLQADTGDIQPKARSPQDDSRKNTGNTFICTNCGYQGKPVTSTGGSFWIEVVLLIMASPSLLFFILPWLLFSSLPVIFYSLWRLTTRREVCPQCKQPNMIPLDTPRGQELAENCAKSTTPSQSQRADTGSAVPDTAKRTPVKRNNKGLVIVACIVSTILVLGLLSEAMSPSTSSQPAAPPASPTATPTTSQATTAQTSAPQPVAYSFSGTGDTVTSSFTLREGLLTVYLTHRGESNFIVRILTTDGADSDYLVNEIGTYDGSVALPVHPSAYGALRPGRYVLEVMADGRWSVRIAG